MTLPQIFDAFDELNVLVVGDVMIDAYLWGGVERISPEAPVPVVSVANKEDRLGGAANVALNLAALGATPIICSVIGKDDKGSELMRLLNKEGLPTNGIVRSEGRVTTTKTRVISNNQQMLRVDEEIIDDLNNADETRLISSIKSILDTQEIHVIVFEDYNKGVLTETLIEAIIAMANEKKIPTAVDPKQKNFFSYRGVTLFKPNLKELKEGLNIELDTNLEALNQSIEMLQEQVPHAISFITLSDAGVYINSDQTNTIIPAHIRNISDVSGAGDTVISVASLCLALGLPHQLMAALANLSGGLVCEKVGVVPIDKKQLLAEAIPLSQ